MTQETCWTLVHAAAAGEQQARADFTRHYLPVVRSALAARWRGSKLQHEIEDAVQDVFVECFRSGGAIERADPRRKAGFRAYLLGIVQNVAARAEKRQRRVMRDRLPVSPDPDQLAADETRLSHAFDREWARSIMRRAGALHRKAARAGGDAAERRVAILRLRFDEGLPIREIAARFGMDADVVHHEYARARREFRDALREVVSFHHPGSAAEIDRQCMQLLGLLQ